MTHTPRLQVLVAAFGQRLERIPPLPVVPGVAYLIGWQCAGDTVPEALAHRDDVTVLPSPGRGSSANRNFLLDNATAELLLISDDDLVYYPEGLASVIRAFDSNPDCQMLAFRHDGTYKYYPSESYDLLTPPKGAASSAIDIALRRQSAAGRLRFDKRFGVGGSLFDAAEDDVFMLQARQARIPGRCLPVSLCSHPGLTTGLRKPGRGVLEAWGAYIALAHPAWQWPIRLALKAYRLSKTHRSPFWKSLITLTSGIRKL